ncbi:hypothetical protein QVG61_10465 [Thiohalobacter sp. IOR34]|uniref:hypothetical protein n=1 Tax=Thiohalobacter sp. IOR34 TaxID=3057176 RepID=UPI0025B1F805|nr:hypothetical protein [Thiohalobacter sp. IOR34]WJW74918.1 hypothetical protein QVG61_10465 [Thiohalobacter sp. IOR34]
MPDSYTRIFLLSHMRALTSLAGHILGSHPLVNGYFEMHVSYEDGMSRPRQLEVLQESESLKTGSRYIFDKLLHNDYRLDLEQAGLADCKILVALQEPAHSIKSIVDLFSRKQTDELYASPLAATDYYIERLQWLADFCSSAKAPYYYYDAEMFQAAPEVLLARLSGWLELSPPLAGHYQSFSQTGKAGKGDSSKRIYSGRIHRTPTDYSHVSVGVAELARARKVYEACRTLIVARAKDAVTLPPSAAR